MKFKRLNGAVGLTLLAGIALSATAFGATTMVYTVTGETISGDLNGVPFVNAPWSITATADSGGASYDLMGGNFPAWHLPVLPTLTIGVGGPAPLIVNMLNSPGADWAWSVVSLDFPDGFAVGDLNGIFALQNDLSDAWGALIEEPSTFFNLALPISVASGSAFQKGQYLTDGGLLSITPDDGGGPGTFTATAVPEVSTTLPTMAMIAGGLMIRRRSNRRH